MSEPELRVCLDESDLDAALRFDARRGLTASPKHLPMRLHYDGRGAALFSELTWQSEYYPSRCEREILGVNAEAIADVLATESGSGAFESPMGAPVSVIELGAGRAEKTLTLLDTLDRDGQLESFWPFDVDAGSVERALDELSARYRDIMLGGIVGDFTRHLEHLPDPHQTRLVAFLGGTFGNFSAMERSLFLEDLRNALRAGDWFLVGADLVKDPAVIVSAYHDAAGITAEFNLNILQVLNDRLGADFALDGFEHLAEWNADTETVALRLRARTPMTVTVPGLDLSVAFAAGESIDTGISTKFRPDDLQEQLRATGFEPERYWTDAQGYFGVFLAQVV